MSYSYSSAVEQRREPRVLAQLAVDLGFALGMTRDVSASGCFVQAELSFEPVGTIYFSLSLPVLSGQIQRRCKGRIVRAVSEGTQTGLAIEILESVMVAG